MTHESEIAFLAKFHALGDDPIPPVVFEIAGDDEPELVWRNELGGLTFRDRGPLREVESAPQRHRPAAGAGAPRVDRDAASGSSRARRTARPRTRSGW